MLQNAYLLAKIGADTAENERNVAKIGNYRAAARADEEGARLPRAALRPTKARKT